MSKDYVGEYLERKRRLELAIDAAMVVAILCGSLLMLAIALVFIAEAVAKGYL